MVKRNDRIAAAGIRMVPPNIARVQVLRVPSDKSLTFITPATGNTKAIAQSSKQHFNAQKLLLRLTIHGNATASGVTTKLAEMNTAQRMISTFQRARRSL